MKTLIDGYQIFPGDHCGSTAMRGLLKHYCGLELPEPAVFGLSAGLTCAYFESAAMDPAVAVFGRTGDLEANLGRILAIDYREQPDPDDAHAWQVVREEVLAGRGAALVMSETDDSGPLDSLPWTAPWAYLRLRKTDYSDAELDAWLTRLTAARLDEAQVFFKHEDEARGPLLAATFISRYASGSSS